MTATSILRSEPKPQVVEYAATQADYQRKFDRRDEAEHILEMARPLLPDAQLLLSMKFEQGLSNNEIADLLDMNTSNVRDRINALVRHIASPQYRLFINHPDVIPPRYRELARQVLIERRTKTDIARDRGVTRAAVSSQWMKILLMARMLPLIEAEARRIVSLVRQPQRTGGER